MLKSIPARSGRLLLLALACATLPACSSRIDAMAQTAKVFFQGDANASAATALNPSVRYLRVEASGRTLFLALGYIDSHPLGPIEVWYSGKGEVLRLQNGHVVGLTGTEIEWRQARLSLVPQWPESSATSTAYSRVRDVMPGYRFGIVDQLTIRSVGAPARSNLALLPASSLRWFEAREAQAALPAARFALSGAPGAGTVVYAEQCFSATFCLSWQQWPPVASSP